MRTFRCTKCDHEFRALGKQASHTCPKNGQRPTLCKEVEVETEPTRTV